MSSRSVLATCRADVAAGVAVGVVDNVLVVHQGSGLTVLTVYTVFQGMAAGCVPRKRPNATRCGTTLQVEDFYVLPTAQWDEVQTTLT